MAFLIYYEDILFIITCKLFIYIGYWFTYYFISKNVYGKNIENFEIRTINSNYNFLWMSITINIIILLKSL